VLGWAPSVEKLLLGWEETVKADEEQRRARGGIGQECGGQQMRDAGGCGEVCGAAEAVEVAGPGGEDGGAAGPVEGGDEVECLRGVGEQETPGSLSLGGEAAGVVELLGGGAGVDDAGPEGELLHGVEGEQAGGVERLPLLVKPGVPTEDGGGGPGGEAGCSLGGVEGGGEGACCALVCGQDESALTVLAASGQPCCDLGAAGCGGGGHRAPGCLVLAGGESLAGWVPLKLATVCWFVQGGGVEGRGVRSIWSWAGRKLLPKKHGGVLLLSTSGGRLAAVGRRWVMAEERFLCISTYEKGQAYMEQLAELGVRPTLLTTDKHRDGDWPREILEELATMPAELTEQQVLNTVTWMARGRKFDRLTALDEFDMEVVARLREHMRIPGMGTSVVANYRDKLAMRTTARDAGFLVPEFVGVLNYDELREYMDGTPGPWLLKPRAEASALGIKKIGEPEQLWRALDELGDRQSYFLLERFVAGDIYHVDSIVSEGKVVFAAVHKYGRPPMQVMHDGGVFTTRTVDRASEDWRELTELNGRLAPALGLRRGVTHGEYIKSRADGKFYFLEIAARVGGAFIADLVEHSTGVNLWREWARIDVAELRGEPYMLPVVREEYAGSVLCLAREADTDTSAFQAPEIVYRMTKHHHAGLIVRSKEPGRVEELLEEYSQAFLEQFMASMPVPDRPTA